MKIERLISWYDKDTQDLVGEQNIDFLEFQDLKKIFMPQPNDPLMYNPYNIYVHEAEMLKLLLDFDFDFERFNYQLDCFQV
ncbi:hypothetical protein KXQ82_15460 [Mucilaginibacter sp. HMF5004]|uniref:DUF7683 domain-containing protein n=1 Tax=Mucilaginibacter rivuli TaxID=2857527 RepID=UPI001C5E6C57|nr:hypothetical protein [Mucilaginibacter rivuli]MBW4891122.1 hypothetical protein [Mucilaginibacter rivuli]